MHVQIKKSLTILFRKRKKTDILKSKWIYKASTWSRHAEIHSFIYFPFISPKAAMNHQNSWLFANFSLLLALNIFLMNGAKMKKPISGKQQINKKIFRIHHDCEKEEEMKNVALARRIKLKTCQIECFKDLFSISPSMRRKKRKKCIDCRLSTNALCSTLVCLGRRRHTTTATRYFGLI